MRKINPELEREMIETTKDLGKQASDNGLDTSQIRNLVNVAQSANCFEEVDLFVRYQAARYDAWRANNFYNILLEELRQAYDAAGGDKKMEVVRLFCGYLARWHKVAKEKVLEEK